MKRSKFTGVWFILPSFLGVCIFVLIPFADVVKRSFTGAVDGTWSGINNYKAVFENAAFRQAAMNTLRFTGVCIPLLLLLSLLISVFLHKNLAVGKFIKFAFLVPMAIPTASVVLVWNVLFDRSGMLNGALDVIGVQAKDWMNSGYAFGVLVFSYLWKNTGYNIVLWMAGLSAIPESIYEAARVDGAGNIAIFFKITLPNLWKVFSTITILSLLNSFKVFREAYLVAGSYPNESIYLIQHLFNNWYRELSMDKLAAAAVIIAVIITCFVLQLWKLLIEE